MITFAGVICLGIAGALLRSFCYKRIGVDREIFNATFFVNITGSFLMGLAMSFYAQGMLDREIFIMIAAGFCSAYTTYSTWMMEIAVLVKKRKILKTILNIALAVSSGILAFTLGLMLT